ncbi:glycosyltransferase family 2 protein [Catenulispora pinisilvae]|uniref:glycosyltransferase family 2 protein n=1 Tax=Catenulispora pinisilvae TaxID=2705253 RepID=UPI0018914C26|nr:glycosyltransferase family 2 protein [Catenulispora pinisilvae]
MSQYPESGYRTGGLAATGQFAAGGYGAQPGGTGQFAVADVEARRRAAAEAAVNAFPNHVVTAVIVSHDGARWLEDSLRGLRGQLRAPQRILAVDTGSKDDSLAILDENLGQEAVLQTKRNTGFGTAVNHALKAAPVVDFDLYGRGDGQVVEWLWLLHDDSEPAPDALLRLLEVGEYHPEAGVIGPKICGWVDREQLLEVGVTVTADGRRWTGLEDGEHDQGQHLEPTRVLSVSSAGMLIRREVWDRLRGFDRAIPMFRDDLDFCWRVNNSGYDVLTAPKAVLWHAEAAARGERRISAGVSRPHFEDRQHALYAVTVNHSGRFPILTFLRLFFWSLLRAIGLLLNKTPLKAADEVLAALAYAGRMDRIIRARRARARTRAQRPVDLSTLFPARIQVFRLTFENTFEGFRSRNQSEEEATQGSIESGPVSEEAESFDSGTPWLIRAVRMPGNFVWIVLLIVMMVAARNLLTGGRLMGGALLPAPNGASDLWHDFFASWHGVATGSTSPAPPYLAVVALLGTLFFGHASLAVTVLLLGSVPLSGLTAYAVLKRTVSSSAMRVWGSAAYALLPAATGAISGGRLGSAVGIMLLPLAASGVLLAIGGPGRKGSVRAAWPAAFAIAIATAFAPIVWLLAAVLAIGATLTVFWRSTADFATVLIRLAILLVTPIAVLMPWSLQLVKHPGALLLEPGLPPVPGKQPDPTHLLLANPGGPGTYAYWITGGLLLAGLAGLLRSGPRRRIAFAGWILALAGFAAGLLALQVRPTGLAGGLPQQPWSGVPTAAIGFGLITAAVIGAEGARDYFQASQLSWRQPAALVVALAAMSTPVLAAAWWVTNGVPGPIQRSAADFRPAVVSVQSQMPDQPRALILASGAQTVIGYGIVRDNGASLGDADYQVPQADAARINTLVGGLLSDSGGSELQGLASLGVRYVVGMKTLNPDYVHILDATPGLDRQSQIGGVNLWKISNPAARLALRGPGTSDPKALQQTSATERSVTATVAAGQDGRQLVLADDADGNWSAKLNGAALPRVTVDGWAQGFQLPAGGGTVTVSYSDVSRTAWLLAEGLIFLFALIMALPTGGRAEDRGPAQDADDYVPPSLPGQQQREPEPEPELEPEPQPEPQPEYASYEQPAEYDQQYQYQQDVYAQPDPYAQQPPQEAYAQQPDPYAQQPDAYAQPDPYGQQPDPYAQQPDPYAQQPDPYAQQPDPYAQQYGGHEYAAAEYSGEYENPEAYGGYLRPGTGEYERPDFETDDHRQGGYR